MLVSIWDEISFEWSAVELDLSLDATPAEICRAVDAEIAEPIGGSIPEGEAWTVKSYSWAGPLLTIECRSGRNHLGIILVNYEENGLPRPTTSQACVETAHTQP